MRYVRYVAPGWGVGELVFEGEVLVHSELPSESGHSNALDARHASHLAERLRRYFVGQREDFTDVELDLEGATTFQRAVTATLRAIPYGETVTYGELAALAGYPGAQRAAGTVCAYNRFGIVVPCHRVVAAGGIGSYGRLGVGYKRRLLELERATL